MYERDGWYLFDGSRVAGPYHVEVLDQLKTASPTPSKLLVTRQGFDRWYPIQHLAEWFKPSETQELKKEIATFQQEVERSARALSGFAPEAQSIQRVATKTIQPRIRNDLHRVAKGQKRRKGKNAKQKPQSADPVKATAHQPKTQPPVVLNIDPSMPAAHNYMLLKGRLRLGDLRSPAIASLIHWMFSLGLYPIFWYRAAYREIYWHAANQVAPPHFFAALCFAVPFMACWSAHRLARDIRSMEEQNQYRATTPWLAGVLGFFPPFALYYMQCALNDHWALHVKSCS